ncbi:MAG: Histidine kinase [Labilithrix sp.]|nr:Histidine kinase [Labilithrix sp.]
MRQRGGEGQEIASEPARLHDADEIHELNERLDAFSAFAGGIIFEFDADCRYIRIWTAQPELLAAPVESLVGHTVDEFLDPSISAMFQEAADNVVRTGEPAAFDYTLDVPAGRRTFSCEMRLRELRPGKPVTLRLITRDVTEAKELQGKLLQAERLAALGLLAASVGHEIRQPLSYVMASLDVLERELATAAVNERASTSLANLRSGSRRIAEIAASLDLLSGRRKREAAPIDVRVPLQAALDLCASELSTCSAVVRSTPELPRVRGDESELCQVFANLLLNAAQAQGPDRDKAHQVTVRASQQDGRVRVVVEDTGSGIAPAHFPHVFDPFFTTKEKGRGTGLGLFISRGIVEAQGGELRISSEPGRGTRVEVLLPIAEPSMATRAPSPSVHESEARRRLEILLVDDEPRFLQSLRLALEADHDVEVQGRGSDALALLEKNPRRYDIVLCDLAMPDIDGATFYARMNALGVADRFILMTGGAFTQRAAEFIANRACPMIAKPFLVEELLALLDRVARRRQAPASKPS